LSLAHSFPLLFSEKGRKKSGRVGGGESFSILGEEKALTSDGENTPELVIGGSRGGKIFPSFVRGRKKLRGRKFPSREGGG